MERSIPKELPLLNELVDFKGSIDLSNTVLFTVQHLLGSNIPLYLILNKFGVDFSRMFVLGKVYSGNPEVESKLRSLGIYVHPKSLTIKEVSLKENYHFELAEYVVETFKVVQKELGKLPKPRQLLVLDDGGVLIDAVHHYQDKIDAEIVAVEQTRNGAELIKKFVDLRFPIVNVAESEAKLLYESPYIATSIINEMQKKLKNLPTKINLESAEVLVVGFGALGREVAKQLRSLGIKVKVHDLDTRKVEEATVSGFIPIELEESLTQSEIIIGCVGKSWLPVNAEELIRDGAVLVSGSSSDVEFSGLEIETDNFIKPVHLPKSKNPDLQKAHGDYKIKLKTGYCWVLNAGFPINFDGSIDPIPSHTIQFTRALMLAGVYDAISKKNQKGLISLDSELQKYLINKFREL